MSVEKQIDDLCKKLGRIYGQLAGALVRRRISRQLLASQLEELKTGVTMMERLMETLS